MLVHPWCTLSSTIVESSQGQANAKTFGASEVENAKSAIEKCMALFTIAKTQNQPKCPSVTDWIKKMW